MGNTASDRKNARCYSLKFSKNTDADIIEKLDSVDSIQGYLKGLIRADIMKEGKKMTYHIKPEFLTQWGSECTEDTIVTGADIRRLAAEWDTTAEELRKQLIPDASHEISLDNGRHYMNAAECIEELQKRSAEYEVPFAKLWQDIADRMDDEIRETVHAELAPCTEEEFLERYLELSPDDFIIG